MGIGNARKHVTKIDTYRVPRPENIEPPEKLQGIDVAERIMNNATSGKILVYFDPDWDGLVAGLFICKVLTKLGKRFSWYVNGNRQHGFKLTVDDLKDLSGQKNVSGWTVMNGDFAVSREKVRELVSAGVSILSLDHHEVEDKELIHELGIDGAEGIVCNNQYHFEDQTNLYQSGAGVTFEVLREFAPWLDNKENRALVGITLLTDIRDIHSERAHQYLHDLYNHKYEGYIKYLIKNTKGSRDFGFGIPTLDRNYVDFNLGPKLNSMFRFNHQDKAIVFILGGGYPSDIDYQKSQKEFVERLRKNAKVTELSHLRVIEVSATHVKPIEQTYLSNFVGLLASRYLDDGKSCIAFSRDKFGGLERASFRGQIQTAPYREYLQEVMNGQGHNIAFGIPGLEVTDGLWERANELCIKAENGAKVKTYYCEVNDLDAFIRSKNSVIADVNQYRKGPDKIYLKYTGASVEEKINNEKIQLYSINGHEVKCFNSKLKPKQDLIQVIMDRGTVQFYLEKKFVPDTGIRISLDL